MYLGGQALGTGKPWQHLQYWKKKKKKKEYYFNTLL
jgi:hypothetical protein